MPHPRGLSYPFVRSFLGGTDDKRSGLSRCKMITEFTSVRRSHSYSTAPTARRIDRLIGPARILDKVESIFLVRVVAWMTSRVINVLYDVYGSQILALFQSPYELYFFPKTSTRPRLCRETIRVMAKQYQDIIVSLECQSSNC